MLFFLIQTTINPTNMKHASHAFKELMRSYLRMIINIATHHDEHICKHSVAWRKTVPFFKPILVIYIYIYIYVTQMNKMITYLGLLLQE